MDEGKEDSVEIVVAGGDAAQALEPTEEPLDLIAVSVECAVVVTKLALATLGRARAAARAAVISHQRSFAVQHPIARAFFGALASSGCRLMIVLPKAAAASPSANPRSCISAAQACSSTTRLAHG